jgi:hypothetical protein
MLPLLFLPEDQIYEPLITGGQWLVPVILAAWDTVIGRVEVEASLGK